MTGPTVGLDEGYRLLREGAAVVEVRRDLVLVEGPDATSYLQGQLSQDVELVGVGASQMTLVLSPQGKVDVWARITRLGETLFALDTDAGWGATLEARLRRFLLRVDVAVRAWEPAAGVGVRGPAWSQVALDVQDPVLRAPVVWPGLPGLDVFAAVPPTPPPDVPRAPEVAWEAVRIEAGLPTMGAELDATTIPEEVGVVAGSVSFTKGCYVGQELVARIDSRGGHVARRLRGVVVEGDEVPAPGTEVLVDAAVAGTVTSAAHSPRLGTVALALLGRQVDLAEGSVVATVRGAPAVVHRLPLV